MTATATEVDSPKPKRSKLGLMIGAALAVIAAAGGFYAAHSGLVLAPEAETHEEHAPKLGALPEVGFVPLEPLVVSLGRQGENRHLRFVAQLEVGKGHESEVQALLPRVTDVLNSYLRAVDVAELEDPSALVRLRAQMLRRIQIVTGEGRVRDLLIMEFVLN